MQSISLLKISFSHPLSDRLFSDLSVSFDNNSRIAIVGDNGSGKTTLLKIISGDLEPESGRVIRNASVHLLPQITESDAKSGGERQKLALARAFSSGVDILLLDEPTNNLDAYARKEFFSALRNWPGGAVIVSHDRELLNQIDRIVELSNGSIRTFGGNYDFYVATKKSERENIESKYTDTEKEITRLNKKKAIATDTANASFDRLGKSKKKGISVGHKFKHGGNHPVDKIEGIMSNKAAAIQKKLDEKFNERQKLSNAMRDDRIKIPMPARPFPRQDLIRIKDMCFGYDQNIFNDFDMNMRGCERVRIAGFNGSGKTTLLRLILGQLKPKYGHVKLSGRAAYLDQNLSLLDSKKSVVENIIDFANLTTNNAHAIAANFGFRGQASDKKIGVLSGGELLRATLATVLGNSDQPDLIILDEPTNNLDIKSTGILEAALNQYQGAILVISHDESFINSLEIDRTIWL